VVPPDLDAWEPWQPAELAARLAGTDVPWCVAGGWALDQCWVSDPVAGRWRTADGIPYLRPELVLFTKAEALNLIYPDHPWRARLDTHPGR
jgi:hypothetical protein